MGRPKGSKNKPREEAFAETLATAAEMPGTQVAKVAQEITEAPAFLTIALTDEDLAPVRATKAKHERAAEEFKNREIQAELARKNAGEIEDLSVPQVVEYDLSGAFNKIAERKAREAGYPFVANLRKTKEGWVFDAYKYNPRPVTHETSDQL